MRHVAATSAPMKPAPITTTRGLRVEAGAQVERVVERAQHEDAVEVGRVRQRARRGAGREHEPSNGSDSSPSQGQEPSGGIERGGPHARGGARRRARRRRASQRQVWGSHSPASSSFDSGGRS